MDDSPKAAQEGGRAHAQSYLAQYGLLDRLEHDAVPGPKLRCGDAETPQLAFERRRRA